uniref:Carboxymuconolactone decarboxylase-like domain-containing protein n=1 Tax=Mucochytrium quahogii TaxID=96639 RepID=A0A7S2WK38_9STRA|mmetsp:Transcript_9279/g.17538  ORF Transcript_9279/g.17538 Transcript_9279/m.17538 type:complete len:178 (+) Transcript_9279:98-631(+)
MAEAPRTARFKGPEVLDQAQQEIVDEIAKTRPGTGLRGPFMPWLANPELANVCQRLGRICRYETSFEPRHSEIIILAVARHHKSQVEWNIHVEEARRFGVEERLIQSIEKGSLEGITGKDLTVVKFARELLETSRVCDDMYQDMKATFSDKHAVEAVSIVGYYSFVAHTLNVFEVES